MAKIIYIVVIIFIVTSCVEEGYFGSSNYIDIKDIVTNNQAINARINRDELPVNLEILAGAPLSSLAIQALQLSSVAQVDKQVGDNLDLRVSQHIVVKSEDRSTHNWTITPILASETPQLDNGDLNQWYKTNSDYFEPGSDATSTIWATGNPGTQILNQLTTVPVDFGNGNLAARMITLDNGSLADTFGAPISAGSIFTGAFNSDKIDTSNPEAALEYGTPFKGRPTMLKLKYQYQGGEVNKDKDGNELGYPDMCDIYALLEIRLGGSTKRLATAWFRSSDTQEDLTNLEIPFSYGELDKSFPDYMYPTDHGFVSADSATFVLPTHITFVGSSSFDGANFAGAIDSELIVDNIEMVYE